MVQEDPNEWLFDVGGWVILGAVALGWVALAQAQLK